MMIQKYAAIALVAYGQIAIAEKPGSTDSYNMDNTPEPF